MLRALCLILLAWSTAAAADTIRIASWNLGGFNEIPEAKLNRIIDGLKKLDADIVVLPELNPRSHAQRIAQRLSEPAGKCYKSEAPEQPTAHQQIGFVFKCSVSVSSPGLVLGSDIGKERYRAAAFIKAKAKNFDFVLVGLHPKAGRSASDRALRTEQMRVVSGFIQGVLLSGENDILVVGDLNMIPGDDDANFEAMNGDGSLRCPSSEDLAGEGSHITGSGIGNLLDGFCFTKVDAIEYRNGSVKIVQLHQQMGLSLAQFKARVTDHLPIVAEFTTDTDHD